MPLRASIIEYGVGNIQSVVNACRRLGVDALVAQDGAALASQRPDRIILPGVGAIGEALANLRRRGFQEVLQALVQDAGTPFLGICVGMQMLAERCEEFGAHEGLGWIPGTVSRLAPEGSGIRLPHVGWNTLEVRDPADPVLGGLNGQDMYFVHSYAMRCPEEFVLAYCEYGGRFVAAVRRGHILAVQFHPEKSAALGGQLLSAFMKEPVCTSAA
ncbi:imidazole glycerol phosphate synthase subunit HisH [Ferrovibrio sp.]|uniref:imidazole glycerol phosphate synthase subunit HisH n=1 Tax=Ferrovibrio sp. TaxID=1917215 RepID=UPI0031202371